MTCGGALLVELAPLRPGELPALPPGEVAGWSGTPPRSYAPNESQPPYLLRRAEPMSRNLAASAGAWSARHRWAAIGIWVLFVGLSIVIGGITGTTHTKDAEGDPGDAGRADRIVNAAG